MASELLIPSRRGFLTGLGASLIRAPAIIRASSLMKVKALVAETVGDGIAFNSMAHDLSDQCLQALSVQVWERYSYSHPDFAPLNALIFSSP